MRKVLFCGLLLAITAVAFGQVTDDIVVGAEIGLGYTAIDLPTALDWDEDYFEDWDQFYTRVEGHALFFQVGPALVGASAAWNRLYYYWVRVPYVPSPLVYEGTVQPVSVGAIAQIEPVDQLIVRAGANLVIFGDGVTIGIRGVGLYRFPISKLFALAAGATVDVIFGSGVPIGIGLALGVDYRLRM